MSNGDSLWLLVTILCVVLLSLHCTLTPLIDPVHTGRKQLKVNPEWQLSLMIFSRNLFLAVAGILGELVAKYPNII